MDIQPQHKKHFASGLITVGILIIGISMYFAYSAFKLKENRWQFESIDTMKYSRDLSREKLHDASFDKEIETQIKHIASTGATHVGIATPYDEEFLPILKRWVKSARDNNLKIWFRGNFSGWEGWFGYARINRDQHLNLTKKFIANNHNLFKDGDVFSSCPECENGGPGDPRQNGDVVGHRKFLIDEYNASLQEFKKIGRKVASNYSSMNFDVAKLIMNRATTKKMGGIVTIDHYVKTPQQLNSDITNIAQISGGKVILGEFGAPIPDINGAMSEVEQAEWVEEALDLLSENPNVIGLNYWINTGGSTEIWTKDGTPKAAASELSAFYQSVRGN